MSMDNLPIGDADSGGTAKTLLTTFGPLAAQLAREQADKHRDRSDIANRWKDIANAVDTLILANLHMELALDLLDSVGETSVPPHLDAAIVRLGVRKDGANPVVAALGIDELDARYLHQRVEQHLMLAEAETEAAGKGLHLNIAARYATLRELALRNEGAKAAAHETQSCRDGSRSDLA